MLSDQHGDSVLDRATVGNNAHHPRPGAEKSSLEADAHMSKRERLSGKVKSILRINNDHINIESNDNGMTLAASPDATSGNSRLDEGPPPGPSSQGFAQLLQHPVNTVKAKTERKTNKEVAANLLSPEITHAQDVELVRAEETLGNATTEEEERKACEDLETLKKARQDLFVRWTMDRHVLKIRRLESEESREARNQNNSHGNILTETGASGWIDYGHELVLQQAEKYGGQYIGSFSEPPPASQETVSASIERLLVASTPWQELMMHIRRIYRWENQKETVAYLVAFITLWALGALCAAGCLATIGQVLRRRFQKPSVERLRQDLMRTEDSLTTAHTLTEQVEKRGAQSWIDPLIEDMGEWLLLQLGDVANLLEVLLNFYEWRQPRRTAWTLVWLGLGCIAFYMTPVWLLVKITSLFAGLTFFGLFPIASRYPKYRLLASPIKWFFWDIPTHAEWAIAHLQMQGQSQVPNEPMEHDNQPRKLGSYTCSSLKHDGRLVVTSAGVRFESFGLSTHVWEVKFNRMYRVEKINAVAQFGSGMNLRLLDVDNEVYTATNVARRDEVFTQIIGYSDVNWQVVG